MGLAILAFATASLVPDQAGAQQAIAPVAGEAWYKVATGVIAVPAALMGLVISWNMMQRSRLETRKLELEISEKQKQIHNSAPAEKLELLSTPLGDSQRALLLIIRFVLLELTLRIWNFVPQAVSYIMLAIFYLLYFIMPTDTFLQVSPTITTIAPTGISFLFRIVYWIIVFGFGWPLFKDTCSFLNIPIRSLLDLPKIGLRKQ